MNEKEKDSLLFIALQLHCLFAMRFSRLGGKPPPSIWRAMPLSVWRVMASRLSKLFKVVELVMMPEFGMDELKQGRRGSSDFSTLLKLTSTLPVSIEFTWLTLEGRFATL